MRRAVLIMFFCFPLCARVAFASSLIDVGYPGEYLLLYAPTARSLAMGGVPTDGASSAFFNPSHISALRSKDLSFMRSSLLSGGIYTASFLAFPMDERRVLSIGIVTLGIDGAEWVDDFGIGNRGTFSDRQSAYSLAYSFPVFLHTDAGAAFKLLRQDIHLYSEQSFGMDMGLRYVKNRRLMPSLSLQNVVAPSMTFREGGNADEYPLNARFSLETKPLAALDFKIDAVYGNISPGPDEKSFSFLTVGAEYSVKEVFRLRAGYNPSFTSVGFGIAMGRSDFDWAMQIREEGTFFSAGISVKWGMMPQLWKKRLMDRESFLNDFSKNLEIEKAYTIQKERTVDAVRDEAVKIRYDAARRYIKNHEYKRAMDEVNAILKLEPQHERAAKLKDDISSGRLKADLHYAMASQYYKNEYYKSALKRVRRAMRLNRDHDDAKFLHNMINARIFIDKGDYYQAKEHLLQAFKMYPDDSECVTLLKGVNDLLRAAETGRRR